MRIVLFFLALAGLLFAVDENQSIEVNVINNSKNSKQDAIIYDYIPQELNLTEEAFKAQNTRTLNAKVMTKIIDARGSGSNEQEALNNALIVALSQLRGVSGENLRQEFKSIKFNLSSLGQIEQNSNQFLQNVSKGRIDTYKINSVKQTEQGVEVEISAYKYMFEHNQKNKLILYDLTHTALSERLKQALSDIFSQSENFQLLQRDENYENENDLLKSEDISSDEIYKLGNVLGADYILEFKILEGQKSSSKINYGEKLSLNIAYKLVFFPTREVIYSKTLNSKLVVSDDINKQQKALEKIALNVNKELENHLFATAKDDKTSSENSKAINYKLGEKGGVDLGF